MLTIWSRLIQDLVLTGDDGSAKLAISLLDDSVDLYRWWFAWNYKGAHLPRLPLRGDSYLDHYIANLIGTMGVLNRDKASAYLVKKHKALKKKPLC